MTDSEQNIESSQPLNSPDDLNNEVNETSGIFPTELIDSASKPPGKKKVSNQTSGEEDKSLTERTKKAKKSGLAQAKSEIKNKPTEVAAMAKPKRKKSAKINQNIEVSEISHTDISTKETNSEEAVESKKKVKTDSKKIKTKSSKIEKTVIKSEEKVKKLKKKVKKAKKQKRSKHKIDELKAKFKKAFKKLKTNLRKLKKAK